MQQSTVDSFSSFSALSAIFIMLSCHSSLRTGRRMREQNIRGISVGMSEIAQEIMFLTIWPAR